MKRNLLLIVVVSTLALFAVPAAAGPAASIHWSGNIVNTYFSTLDPTGCIETVVYVDSFKGSAHALPGPRILEAGVFIAYARYDWCEHTYLMEGWGTVPLSFADLSFDPRGRSANLNTIVEVFDWHLGEIEVSLNLRWEAVGPPTRENQHYNSHVGEYTVNSHSNGVWSPAEASGTVTVTGINLTPEPSVYASIGSSKWGVVSIWR